MMVDFGCTVAMSSASFDFDNQEEHFLILIM